MSYPCFFCALLAALAFLGIKPASAQKGVKAPAVPLIVRDPYLNIWSAADHLTDAWPVAWNGPIRAIAGMIRIDGRPFRFIGLPDRPEPPLPQIEVHIYPTQTVYRFQGEGVALELTFLTPFDPKDLQTLSLPVTYLYVSVKASGPSPRNVQLYLDISGEWAAGDSSRSIVWETPALEGEGRKLRAFAIRSQQASPLTQTGEYPDWGFPVWAVPDDPALTWEASGHDVRRRFAASGKLGNRVDSRQPRPVREDWPVFAFAWDLGDVSRLAASRRVALAHIKEDVTRLMGETYKSLWTAYYPSWQAMLLDADARFPAFHRKQDGFDRQLLAAAWRAGGEDYATLVSLCLRQSFAGAEFGTAGGKQRMFVKEISSGGFIQTVDVLYPASPVFLLLNPDLLKMQLDPVFDFVESGLWQKPFAPHDLGFYPVATGQTYGGDMPVEESGNMLLMTAAYTARTGKAEYAAARYPALRGWADYLIAHGLRPERQLCTDDFTGPIDLNTNLALKAIFGVGAFARMAKQAGNDPDAARYRAEAERMMAAWLRDARSGDRFRMVYDDPDSWSLKYNVFYERLLALNLFPKEALAAELRHYLARQNAYGTPLDGRHTYTKGDWLSWIAAAAPDRKTGDAFLKPLVRFLKESPSRVPFSDWHDTITGQSVGFAARPVVGAIFALLLMDAMSRPR
ncbi:MAG: DUF4965 domain-containing protein [Armatimonadetes bacterium]|nr:DUF4965 domain-containing protein [Armatimonadota bacterium]